MSERASHGRRPEERGPRENAERFRGVQVRSERADERSREEAMLSLSWVHVRWREEAMFT